jgi:hypothetical protein
MEKSQRVKLTVLVAFVALLLLNGTGSPFIGNLGYLPPLFRFPP